MILQEQNTGGGFFVGTNEAGLMRLAIANHRKAKKLLRAWEAQTQRLIDLKTPE